MPTEESGEEVIEEPSKDEADTNDDWYEKLQTDPVLAKKIMAIDQEAVQILRASQKYIKQNNYESQMGDVG